MVTVVVRHPILTGRTLLTDSRIDGLIPNTPASRKGAVKKTPTSRVKSEHLASSPDHKSPGNLKDQLDSMGGLPYVPSYLRLECTQIDTCTDQLHSTTGKIQERLSKS